MYKLSLLDKISFILAIIGTINLGVIGLFNFNLLYHFFGTFDSITRIFYTLIGVAGIDIILFLCKNKIGDKKQK